VSLRSDLYGRDVSPGRSKYSLKEGNIVRRFDRFKPAKGLKVFRICDLKVKDLDLGKMSVISQRNEHIPSA